MFNPTLRIDVNVGSLVEIDISYDPERANIVTGIVKIILTCETYCKDCIEVILDKPI